MKDFISEHLTGIGGFITAVSGSTGDYDLTLDDGHIVYEYDETANIFGTSAPVLGDLALYGSQGDAGGDASVASNCMVIPAREAHSWLRFKDEVAPTCLVFTPLDEATGVVATVDPAVTLSKAGCTIASAALITLFDGAGTPLTEPGTPAISGTTLTYAVTGANMNTGEVYTFTIGIGAIADRFGTTNTVAYEITFTIA